MYGAWAAFCIKWCMGTRPSLPWPSSRRCMPSQTRATASPLTPSRTLLWQTPSSAAWTEALGPASRCRCCLPTNQLPKSLCDLHKHNFTQVGQNSAPGQYASCSYHLASSPHEAMDLNCSALCSNASHGSLNGCLGMCTHAWVMYCLTMPESS